MLGSIIGLKVILIAAGLLMFLALSSNWVKNTGLSERGLRSEFFEAYDGTNSFFEQLSTRIPSNKDSEKYAWLGSVPMMREWGTGRKAMGLRSESYSVENQEYEATVECDRKEVEDDQTGQIVMRVRELAEYARTHKDYLIEELIKNGELPGFHSFDGVPFFSEAHVSGDSGAQSNLLTYEAVDPNNVTAAERRAGLAQAIGKMMAFKNDRGQPVRIQPTGLIVAVHPEELVPWLEALNQTLVTGAGTAISDNVLRSAASALALPGLADRTKFYLLKTDTQVRPFIFQDRSPMEFSAIDQGSEHTFKTGKMLYGTRARYRMTYGYWWYAVRTQFIEPQG